MTLAGFFQIGVPPRPCEFIRTIARWYAQGWRHIRRIRSRLLVTHSMSPAAY
jgi:hypothetical protein